MKRKLNAYNPLAEKFNFGSLMKFAFPNIMMMIFLSLYTIVDGMFISRYVGTTALSAVNMVFPAVSLQMAVSIMISTGGSAVIARKLGLRDVKTAKSDLTFLVISEAFMGFMALIFGTIFADEIIGFLGASEAQFEICKTYFTMMLWFSPLFALQSAFQSFFVTAGKPGLGLFVTVFGGLTNIVLDYIFIVVFDMGVAGAALGTGIGGCIPSVAGLIYFTFSKKCELHFGKPSWNFKMLFRACGNGASEMVVNLANAISTFLFNILFMKFYGEDGVAAITIILYFQFVFTAVFFGFSGGIAPVISYKYGSDDKQQLKSIFKTSIIFILGCSAVLYFVSVFSVSNVLHIFTPGGSNVYNITMNGFMMYAIAFALMGINIFASALFTAFSDGIVSAIISFARTLLFLVLTLLAMPILFGETGLWFAVPTAEVMGVGVSIYFLIKKKKKYGY